MPFKMNYILANNSNRMNTYGYSFIMKTACKNERKIRHSSDALKLVNEIILFYKQ